MEHFQILEQNRTLDSLWTMKHSDQFIPKNVHLIWVGNPNRPSYVIDHVNRWKRLMPEWTVKLWTDEDISETHFSVELISLIQTIEKGAQKADIMRYFIMEKYGGIYLDTDIIPYRSMDIVSYLGDLIVCHDMPITWPYIAIGFFASVPHHPVLQYACQIIETHSIQLNTEDIHMHTGPRLFGQALFYTRPRESLKYIVLPITFFYRNLTGLQGCGGYLMESDIEERFGSHFYAKGW